MEKSRAGIRDENPESFFRELCISFLSYKYLNSLMRIRIRDLFNPGSGIRDGKKTDPGSGINIPDPPHWLEMNLTLGF
jgi:hypothetical protein